jgi:hypothetical protein
MLKCPEDRCICGERATVKARIIPYDQTGTFSYCADCWTAHAYEVFVCEADWTQWHISFEAAA